MSATVCVSSRLLRSPQKGGLMWVYLNWALGFREAGCDVIWLERVHPLLRDRERALATLKRRLAPYGFDGRVSCWFAGADVTATATDECLPLEAAWEADLLLDLGYIDRSEVVGGFRRSAVVDIDPGLTQTWIARGKLQLPAHDVYFSVGERVPPTGSIRWEHISPCVSTRQWRPVAASDDAAFTTVTHWSTGERHRSGEQEYQNDKRAAFQPYLELPRLTSAPLELAVHLVEEEGEDAALLQQHGWRLADPSVAVDPWGYHGYVERSLGEFSCAKPSYVAAQNGWISDRTPCFLAAGKPVVLQDTGPSRLLADGAGVRRFRSPAEAAAALDDVLSDYHNQCRLARRLAEERFDACTIASSVLERVLS